MNKEHRFRPRRYKADRLKIALSLYPYYLAFMEEHSGDAGLPLYDFQSAAGDAVQAADYLLEAITEGPK